MSRVLAVLFAAALLLGVAAGAARAGDFEFGMEDEGLMLGDPASAPPEAAKWKQLGVDIVRIHADWWELAPGVDEKTMPFGFKPGDAKDRQYQWSSLDAAIGIAHDAGLKVMLTVTGPGPLWTSADPSKDNRLYKPKPDAFADFAHAVATRYKDTVDRYLIWNEPNQKGWLQPQWQCDSRNRNCTPLSPHLYRDLANAAIPAIKAADPGADIIVGELAPIGDPPISVNTPMRPMPFLRALGCVDEQFRTIKTGLCKKFKAVQGNTLGYHPHPKKTPPDKVNPDPEEAQLGDLSRLFSTLDKLRASKRLRIGKMIDMTEFGYETSPPDPVSGVSLALQTRYLQQAAFVAWQTKRVRGIAYYEWLDDPVRNLGSGSKRYTGWQTALIFNNGKPKPALSTMPAPFVIQQPTRGRSYLFWGQVRPDADRAVTILVRPKGSSQFKELAKVFTLADGTWSKRVIPTEGASYRYQWTPKPSLLEPLPKPKLSGIVDLSKKEPTLLHASAAIN